MAVTAWKVGWGSFLVRRWFAAQLVSETLLPIFPVSQPLYDTIAVE